jgi:hypothetical protein
LTCALFYHATGHPGQPTQTTLDRVVGPHESHVRENGRQHAL